MNNKITFSQLKSLVMEAKEKSKDMDRIRDMEKQPVTGYLLEISDDGKNWKPYEFDAPYEANWYEVDEPYRDCEVTIHSVKGDREYGMKYYDEIKWFESRHALEHWLNCGVAGTDGAEQDHYYSMLDQLECGVKVVDYNEV